MAKVIPFACSAALAQARAWGERAAKTMGECDNAETKKMPGVREKFFPDEREPQILLQGLPANGKTKQKKWDDKKVPGVREGF